MHKICFIWAKFALKINFNAHILHNYSFMAMLVSCFHFGWCDAMSIHLNNINCFYGSQQALFDITLNCPTGETLVLLGPSGAGKSSLLRVLNLLEMPRSGQLAVAGKQFDFSQKQAETTVRDLRQRVGMVFQQYNLWPHLTVMQNLIEAPCKVLGLGKAQAVEKVEKLLARLHLTGFADRYPLHLSGGQQQRVAIARALMMEPQVLLFDEPTAALDPEITAQIAAIIHELSAAGMTQVIVTHEVDFARKTASQVVYMEQGRIIEQSDAGCFSQPKTAALAHYLSH